MSVFLSVCFADEVILNEGKTLTGQITDEDADELTIHLGSHMDLHVEKSKVKEIHRDPKPVSTRPIITMKEEKKKPPATLLLPISPINNAQDGTQTTSQTKDGVNYLITVETKTFPVEGAEDANADSSTVSLDVHWAGKLSKEGTDLKWDSLTVFSTTTILIPTWNGPKNADPAEIQKWNSFYADLGTHNQGHLDIYTEAISSIGSGLILLRADSEADLKLKSDHLVKQVISRAENKQRGYDRREKTKQK